MIYDPYLKIEENQKLYDTMKTLFYRTASGTRIYIHASSGSGKTAYAREIQKQVVGHNVLKKKNIKVIYLTAKELTDILEWDLRIRSLYGSNLERRSLDNHILFIDDIHLLQLDGKMTVLLQDFVKRTQNLIFASTEPFENMERILGNYDFKQIKIEKLSEESVHRIVSAYVAHLQIPRMTPIMVDTLVELYAKKLLTIREIKEILQTAKAVSENVTVGTLHPENFHRILAPYGLDRQAFKMIWLKLCSEDKKKGDN